MKKLVLFVAACLMAVSLQAARCAVLGFESAASVSITQVDGIEAMFMTYFQPAGYIMVDRHDFEVLLEEQDLQSSDLTTDQMVEMGRILNVSKIVRGTVSMLGGFYQVDVRVVDVETSTYISDGTTFRGDNYRENVKTLATRLAAKVAIRPGAPVMPSQITPTQPTPPTTTPPTQPTPPTQTTPAPAPVEPYVLYGYLKIFPNDLGTFETEPKTIIARLNQNKQYGYSTWRLPTNEELALMKANRIIGNTGNYQTQEHPTGIVRLVTDKEKGDTIAVTPPAPTHQSFIETASGLNMKMIWVEGGEFLMGCTNEQGNACDNDEMNVRRVTLDGFYIGMLEVTQAQWKQIMGTTPRQQLELGRTGSYASAYGDDYPMYYVTWNEARDFCSRLSRLTNRNYTLPTEAQWEYAARGGQHASGTKYAGSNVLGVIGWYEGNSSDRNGERPHTCGTKQANSLGIYDMSGNVYEWCDDWYTDSYMTYVTNNPTGPSSGNSRVVRGGSWNSESYCCRVTDRYYNTPETRSGSVGFRVVLIP